MYAGTYLEILISNKWHFSYRCDQPATATATETDFHKRQRLIYISGKIERVKNALREIA